MKEARSKHLSAKFKGLRLVINGESYTAQQLRERTPEPQEIPMMEGQKRSIHSNSHTRPSLRRRESRNYIELSTGWSKRIHTKRGQKSEKNCIQYTPTG
ncbi:hypothetical protein JTB14_007556 [Gonioctena quinquepunctata]|nr:hypothetical protein JTB14_007556 [Gonioctena quinquepunctata]